MNLFNPNKFTPDPKPEPKAKKKAKGLSRYKKPTGEKPMFENIWNSRPHKSEISETPIPEPSPFNFLHVIPKGQNKYPKFKLYEKNIVLGTYDEHHIWDNARHLADPEDPKWARMYALEAVLIQEYKIKYPD